MPDPAPLNFRYARFPHGRLSGLEENRPAAEESAGGRYYAVDTETIFVSHGFQWNKVFSLEKPIHELDGPLVDRPDPSTCVGTLYTDEDGLQYEAFPTAWATVNIRATPTEPNEGIDASTRQLFDSNDTPIMIWASGIIFPNLPTANPGISGQLWLNGGVPNISTG